MAASQLAIFAASAGLLLMMPGPTNAVIMASGAASGLRNSMPLAPVVLLGYLVAMAPLLALGEVLGTYAGMASLVLRSIAALVVAGIAVKLWVDATRSVSKPGRPGSTGVFVLTLCNPKVLIFSFGIMPPLEGVADLSCKCAILGGLILISAWGWIAVGAGTRKLAAIPGHRIAKMSSLVLVCFAVYLLTTVVGEIAPFPL